MKYEFSGKNLVNFWNKNLGGGNEKEFSENSVYESCKGWQESAEKEIKSYTTPLETIDKYRSLLVVYQFYVKIIHQKLKEKRLWQKLQSFFYPKIKDQKKLKKTIVAKFLKYFISRWFGTKAMEKVVITALGELVKRTESKIDDKIYEVVFGKLEEEKNDK